MFSSVTAAHTLQQTVNGSCSAGEHHSGLRYPGGLPGQLEQRLLLPDGQFLYCHRSEGEGNYVINLMII